MKPNTLWKLILLATATNQLMDQYERASYTDVLQMTKTWGMANDREYSFLQVIWNTRDINKNKVVFPTARSEKQV